MGAPSSPGAGNGFRDTIPPPTKVPLGISIVRPSVLVAFLVAAGVGSATETTVVVVVKVMTVALSDDGAAEEVEVEVKEMEKGM